MRPEGVVVQSWTTERVVGACVEAAPVAQSLILGDES